MKTSLPAEYVEILKAEYPRRLGDNGWIHVRTLVPRALTAGATWERILAGTRAYKTHCDTTGKTGTELVKQARTFYGSVMYFEEWADMQPVKTVKAQAEETRWEALKVRAKACGFRPPTTLDSEGAFETSLRLAEQERAAALTSNKSRPVVDIVSALAKAKRA